MYISIDTEGQDCELQDELDIEENGHDPGITSVSAFRKYLYSIFFDEVERTALVGGTIAQAMRHDRQYQKH
jgi:hypothetical protein